MRLIIGLKNAEIIPSQKTGEKEKAVDKRDNKLNNININFNSIRKSMLNVRKMESLGRTAE